MDEKEQRWPSPERESQWGGTVAPKRSAPACGTRQHADRWDGSALRAND